jgi:hypothetical protein
MKKTLFSLLLSTFTSLIFSQGLVDIPLKNGMAYYVFEHTLDNSTNCLSHYLDGPLTSGLLPFQQKLITKTVNFSFSNLKLSCNFGFQRKGSTLKCIDTIKYSASNLTINENTHSRWNPSFFSKKVVSNKVTASVSIVFLSKNKYKIIVKDIVYNCGVIEGFGKIGFQDYKLGEAYLTVKNSKKISRGDLAFFNDIDLIIKQVDKIILETFVDTIQADEL